MNELMQQSHFAKVLKVLELLLLVGVVYLVIHSVNEFRAGRYIGRDIPAQNTISVSGKGEVFAKPDIATFSFTVSEEGKNVAEAQQKATNKTNAAIDAVKKAGVAEKDIKTLGYNINPKYEYYYQAQVVCSDGYCPPQPIRNPKIVGYEVSQTVEVKVRDISKAGDLLTTIGAIGVSNVSGLSFSIDEEERIKTEAREAAIKEAREKAKALAKDLDVSLVRIINFSESGNYPIYYSYGKGGIADSAVSVPSPEIPSGENSIVSNVTIVYEIR